jgi:hypothetical protein
MARCFRFSRFAALCASAAVLSVSNIHGVGLQALFSIGLIPNVFSLPLFLVALGTFHLAATLGGRFVPLAAACVSLVVAAHFISGVYLGLACVLYVLIACHYRRRPRRTLARAVGVGFLSLGMFALMWIPTVVYQDLIGPFADFGDFPFFRDFVRGDYLGSRATNWLAVAFIVGVRRWRFPAAFLIALCTLTLPFALGWIQTRVHAVDDFIFHIFRFRSFAHLGLFAALFAGDACDAIRRLAVRIARALNTRWLPPTTSWAVGLTLFCLLAVSTSGKVQKLRPSVQVDAHHHAPEKGQYLDAYHWLRAHAPVPRRCRRSSVSTSA